MKNMSPALSWRHAILLLLLLLAPIPAQSSLTTEYLDANNLTFTCTILKHATTQDDSSSTPSKSNVYQIMLLHGFPNFRGWWMPLLEYWDELMTMDNTNSNALSIHAVLCDLRGYSPGASPGNIEAYDYSILADDIFALAQAAGFEEETGFHLLGHDHGAALAWQIAADDNANQVLSLTALSVPHLDLMSKALCSDDENEEDEDQIIASNYFSQFSVPNSATLNNATLTNVFNSLGSSFEPEDFHRMLWWYNGSLAKYFALPRVVSDNQVDAYQAANGFMAAFFVKAIRNAIPLEERPCIPAAAGPIGPIEIPTLFVCGVDDFAILCNNTWATDVPPELLPNHQHVNFQCGHDFFLEYNCDSMEECQAVIEKITAFVFGEDVLVEISTLDGDATDANNAAASSGGKIANSMVGVPAGLLLVVVVLSL